MYEYLYNVGIDYLSPTINMITVWAMVFYVFNFSLNKKLIKIENDELKEKIQRDANRIMYIVLVFNLVIMLAYTLTK